MAALLALGVIAYISRSEANSTGTSSSFDVIIVLAGGVTKEGRPLETVQRRLVEAARVYQEQVTRSGVSPTIICNGGGTTHKPKWADAAGYAVPEAALMARELTALGVKTNDVYVEGYSDDTIGEHSHCSQALSASTSMHVARTHQVCGVAGNAFFARVMHADVRPTWVNILIITSEFQMARTQAIYGWIFKLQPLPTGKPAYHLGYLAVDDKGALPKAVLRSRRSREATSLQSFQRGALVRKTELASVHEWIYQVHSAYTANGMLSKKPLNRTSALAQTY